MLPGYDAESQVAEILEEKPGHAFAEDEDDSRHSSKVLSCSVSLPFWAFRETMPSQNY